MWFIVTWEVHASHLGIFKTFKKSWWKVYVFVAEKARNQYLLIDDE